MQFKLAINFNITRSLSSWGRADATISFVRSCPSTDENTYCQSFCEGLQAILKPFLSNQSFIASTAVSSPAHVARFAIFWCFVWLY